MYIIPSFLFVVAFVNKTPYWYSPRSVAGIWYREAMVDAGYSFTLLHPSSCLSFRRLTSSSSIPLRYSHSSRCHVAPLELFRPLCELSLLNDVLFWMLEASLNTISHLCAVPHNQHEPLLTMSQFCFAVATSMISSFPEMNIHQVSRTFVGMSSQIRSAQALSLSTDSRWLPLIFSLNAISLATPNFVGYAVFTHWYFPRYVIIHRYFDYRYER